MNQLAIQDAVMTNSSAVKGLRELFGQQAAGSDAFAALIQQLLGGAGDEENFAMLMQQMDAVQKQDEEEGTNLAMQMMAELLLSGNPQAQELLSRMGIELTPEQAAAAGNVGRQNMLIPAPVQQEQPKGEQEEPVVFEVVSETRRAMGQPQDGKSADMSLMQGRGNFQSAIYEARQSWRVRRANACPSRSMWMLCRPRGMRVGLNRLSMSKRQSRRRSRRPVIFWSS